MLVDRSQLRRLQPGDMIAAQSGPAVLICLVEIASEQNAVARRITGGGDYVADQRTGLLRRASSPQTAAPSPAVPFTLLDHLPPEFDQALRTRDQRYRSAVSDHDYRLQDDEKAALAFVSCGFEGDV